MERNGCLQTGRTVGDAAVQLPTVMLRKKRPTMFGDETEVGVEWSRGCLAEQALHFRVFVRSVVAAGQLQRFLFRRAPVGQSGAETP